MKDVINELAVTSEEVTYPKNGDPLFERSFSKNVCYLYSEFLTPGNLEEFMRSYRAFAKVADGILTFMYKYPIGFKIYGHIKKIIKIKQ